MRMNGQKNKPGFSASRSWMNLTESEQYAVLLVSFLLILGICVKIWHSHAVKDQATPGISYSK